MTIALFSLTLGQFYALNGANALIGLQSQFFTRSAGAPLDGWISRITWISELNFNILFLIGAVLGLILFLAKIKKDNHIFYLPIVIAPLFVLLVFREWSTHPFGVIDFLPAVALLNGFLLTSLIKEFNLKIFGYIIIIAALGLGFYFSLQKLDFFYNQFLLLGPKDIPLIQQLKPQIQNDEL